MNNSLIFLEESFEFKKIKPNEHGHIHKASESSKNPFLYPNFKSKSFVTNLLLASFQSLCCLAQLFLDTSAVILRKKSEIVGEIFSSSENAIWSILLKYQETDVQIQTFTDENSNILHSCFFERYYLPICRVQILKIWTLYFYSCAALGNSLSVARKVHDFRYIK